MSITFNPGEDLPVGERTIGTVTKAPVKHNSGIVTRNSDSRIVGSFNVFPNGNVYMNLITAVSQSDLIYCNLCGA